ncbi:MAG TPA: hypothetical protein VFL72_03710 [Acidimicrobiia bacterium]|nr:hypothetical protein [Acidimicrobiia bacterium]
MPNGQGSESVHSAGDTVRVQAPARPWSGLLLGILLGLSIAVMVQQAGVWPLDRLLVFGSAGLFGLLGILLTGWGRERVSGVSGVLPLLIGVLLLVWGATGLTQLNESGELNGGCTVEAQSDVDTTVMTDTTRQDPFEIDPEGGLSWFATSPAPIMDHTWEIWVDVGGFAVVVAEGGDPNSAGDLENQGDVPDLSVYVEEVTTVSGQVIRGVFEVGGNIEGTGGACDGFAFVRLTSDPFSTLVSQIAAGVALISLISLIAIAMRRTRVVEVVDVAPEQVNSQTATPSPESLPSEGTEVDAQPEEGLLGGGAPGDDDSGTGEPGTDQRRDDDGFPPTT